MDSVTKYSRELFDTKPETVEKYGERIPAWADDLADAIMDESTSEEDELTVAVTP